MRQSSSRPSRDRPHGPSRSLRRVGRRAFEGPCNHLDDPMGGRLERRAGPPFIGQAGQASHAKSLASFAGAIARDLQLGGECTVGDPSAQASTMRNRRASRCAYKTVSETRQEKLRHPCLLSPMSLGPVLDRQPFEAGEVLLLCSRQHRPIHMSNRSDLAVSERRWSAQRFKPRSLFAVPRCRNLVVGCHGQTHAVLSDASCRRIFNERSCCSETWPGKGSAAP
jgi:hypothetical protein